MKKVDLFVIFDGYLHLCKPHSRVSTFRKEVVFILMAGRDMRLVYDLPKELNQKCMMC